MIAVFRSKTFAIIFLASLTALHAVEIHVALSGDNANPGTDQKPLRTIQAAVDRMEAGDVCLIQAGNYREAVKIEKSGSPGRTLWLQAAPGAQVILDGTDVVMGKWEKYKGNIYRIKQPKGIQQVFVGDQMMIEARWPNMRFDQRFDRSCWAKTEIGSTHGKLVSKEIAESGIDWTGAMACLNVAHQWWTWNRPIIRHKAGSDTLEYDADLVGLCDFDPKITNRPAWQTPEWLAKKWGDNRFYLFGKLDALDVETEWFQDPTNGMLYFYAPGGVDPSTLEVRYKARDYSLYATNQSCLEIKGINFFATTFRLDDCNHCTVKNCELLYPTWSRTITEYDQARRESVITKVTG